MSYASEGHFELGSTSGVVDVRRSTRLSYGYDGDISPRFLHDFN